MCLYIFTIFYFKQQKTIGSALQVTASLQKQQTGSVSQVTALERTVEEYTRDPDYFYANCHTHPTNAASEASPIKYIHEVTKDIRTNHKYKWRYPREVANI